MTAERVPGGFRVRLRFGRDPAGKPQRDRFLIVTQDSDVAGDRETRMRTVADALAKLRHAKAREFLTEMGAVAEDERAFRGLEAVAQKLIAEAAAAPPATPASGPVTFGDVVEQWTSGKLTADYPDSRLVPAKEDRSSDLQKAKVFLPLLGHRPIREITVAETDEARKLIPPTLEPSTRLGYLKTLRLVFRIAIDPLGLIESVPMKALPKQPTRRQFWFLFPDEEARLLAQEDAIPLLYRVLYGFLSRNGTRIGETLRITWDHIDFARKRIRLEAAWTKTRRARFWVLDDDVVRSLKRWRAALGNPPGETRIFASKGGRLSARTVRDRFLDDVRAAGVHRPELFVQTEAEGRLRIHDLRASFVTLTLRAGWPVKTIMSRSGHESLKVLQDYDRLIEDANQLDLPAWFAPMDQAIPEFRRAQAHAPLPLDVPPGVGQPWATTPKNQREMGYSPTPRWSGNPAGTEQKPAEIATSVAADTPPGATSGPAEIPGVGQPGPGQAEVSGPADTPYTDPVDRALAFALEAATRAEQWAVVLEVTRELSERRRARTAPTVPSLSDARAKREKGEGGK